MKCTKRRSKLLGLIFAAVFFSGLVSDVAFSESLTAYEIMKKVDQRDDGKTSISTMTMVLINSKGKKREPKIMKGYRKDFGEDTKSISFILSPAIERNISVLSYEWEDDIKEDDNWVYLPSLGRPKRISGTGKKGAFMGSDFTYSDMNGLELNDWNYKILKKSTKVKGHDCWIIGAIPKESKRIKVKDETDYIETVSWIRKDIFMMIQGRMIIKKNKKKKPVKYKIFIASDIEEIDGIWSANKLTMKEYRGKKVEHSTVLKFDSISYNEELEDTLFTVQRMARGF